MDNKISMVDLQYGRTPNDKSLIRNLTVGQSAKVADFIRKEYLASYIKQGGSKIKFITGKPGSGKTHLSHLIAFDAEDEGYLTVCLDANKILLSDMTNLYLAIVKEIDFRELYKKISISLIQSLGYNFDGLTEGKTIIDWLTDEGESVAIARQEIRSAIRKLITENQSLDHNLAQIVTLRIYESLGLIDSLDENTDFVFNAFLNVDSTIKVPQLRAAGLAGYKINKTNARAMIKSLSVLLHIAGYSGLFVSLDNLENIVNTNTSIDGVKYTKMKRDDAYEVIRQLIDDIDVFKYFFLLFSFDKVLIDNEKLGFKSYQALWMRIQNEIVSPRINLFVDLLDADKISSENMTPDSIMEMSKKLKDFFESENFEAHQIDEEEAEKIIQEARYGSSSIPLLVNKSTLSISVKED